MLTRICFFILCFISSFSYSQKKAIGIKGIVVGMEDQKPIEFANVLLIYKDSLMCYATTDFKGAFTINFRDSIKMNEELKVKIMRLGYHDQYISFTPSKLKLYQKNWLEFNISLIAVKGNNEQFIVCPGRESGSYDPRGYQWTGRTYTHEELLRMPRRP